MATDPFFKKPFRSAKGQGTKCTTCEIVEPCSDSGKCIFPLLCATLNSYELPGCDTATFIEAGGYTETIRYDCARHGFDLSVQCSYDLIDFFMTYEEIYGETYAVLRSTFLDLEVMVAFTDANNARCPTFDFGVMTTRPYPTVAVGPQMCIDSGPDDCTAGRCLPRFLCAAIATPETVDDPYLTTLEWYTDDSVVIDDICCCSANTFPATLIARVINFSSQCSCIAPPRIANLYSPAEHVGADIDDPGALLHLRHRVASMADAFVTGYPFVQEGAHVWEAGVNDGVSNVCPSPEQPLTVDTRQIDGRMLVWCDPYYGEFKAAFELVDRSAGNPDSLIPFNLNNANSTVTVFDSVDILACNPFTIRCRGIVEDKNCQTINNVDQNAPASLEIVVSEFQGWVGDDPLHPGAKITLYSDRVVTAAAAQTTAADCILKLHYNATNTFKGRRDKYTIDNVWPDPVWLNSNVFRIDTVLEYIAVSFVEVHPQSCNGCETVPIDDPYGPVRTECCESLMPRKLYITSVETNDCDCADGTVIEINYDDETEEWTGGGNFGTGSGPPSCPQCAVSFVLRCEGLVGSSVMKLYVYFDGVLTSTFTAGTGGSFSCDPLTWVTPTTGANGLNCCKSVMAAAQYYWVITS